MAKANANKMLGMFRPAQKGKQGQIGYDNIRENIDPHVRTGAVTAKEGTVQHTPTNAKDIATKEYVDSAALWTDNGTELVPKNNRDILLDPTGAESKIYGGDGAGKHLGLYAAKGQDRPHILIRDANNMQFDVDNLYAYYFRENNNLYLTLRRNGCDWVTSATTGGPAVSFNLATITSGQGIKITGDSDDLTTGYLLGVFGGASRDKDWMKVIMHSGDNESGQIILNGSNNSASQTVPDLRLGTGQTGFTAAAGDKMYVIINGSMDWIWDPNTFQSQNTAGPVMVNEAASSTNPTLIPDQSDKDTGIGQQAADNLSLIAGGTEIGRVNATGIDVTGTLAATTVTGANVTSGSNPGHTHTLDNLENPSANKAFTMANKQIKFTYQAPATADGGFEIEATGGFSGDLVHIHQHSGNPGTTDLLHCEADDNDVSVIRACHTGTGTAFAVGPHGSEVFQLNESGDYVTTATNTTAWLLNMATVTSGTGLQVDVSGLTSGVGVDIIGDSDTLTTGSVFGVFGGTAQDKDWLRVIKNTNDTEGGQVIIDGSNVAGTVATPALRIGTGEDGFYQQAVNNLGLAINGAQLIDYSAGAVGVTGTLACSGVFTGSGGAVFGAAVDFGAAGFNVLNFCFNAAPGGAPVPAGIADGEAVWDNATPNIPLGTAGTLWIWNAAGAAWEAH